MIRLAGRSSRLQAGGSVTALLLLIGPAFAACPAGQPKLYGYDVVKEMPHDPNAFTQGACAVLRTPPAGPPHLPAAQPPSGRPCTRSPLDRAAPGPSPPHILLACAIERTRRATGLAAEAAAGPPRGGCCAHSPPPTPTHPRPRPRPQGSSTRPAARGPTAGRPARTSFSSQRVRRLSSRLIVQQFRRGFGTSVDGSETQSEVAGRRVGTGCRTHSGGREGGAPSSQQGRPCTDAPVTPPPVTPPLAPSPASLPPPPP
jgi:hypothetical protein